MPERAQTAQRQTEIREPQIPAAAAAAGTASDRMWVALAARAAWLFLTQSRSWQAISPFSAH